MQVRVATAADIEVLVELHSRFCESLQKSLPTREDFRCTVARVLALPEVRIYIAECDGIAVGYTTQRFLATAWSLSREALLEDLFVIPERRGAGAGRRLVQFAMSDAAANGCGSMFLDTNEKNEASNTLYRQLGFTAERARWSGGKQIRYDVRLPAAAPIVA